jgi:hypothetical protein
MTISLAFLAPRLVKVAVDGRMTRGIGVARLFDAPVAWSRQQRTPGRGGGKNGAGLGRCKVIASHIGLNPETQRQMIAGELEVELSRKFGQVASGSAAC